MGQGDTALDRVFARHPPIGLWPHDLVIQPLHRLSAPEGPVFSVLRDDLIGFGLGGNKVRKLDYLLGDAVRRGATTLLTSSASSFSRNAAAAASALGLALHVVVKGSEAEHNALSRGWFDACGATLHYALSGSDAEVDSVLQGVEADASARGETVVRLHPGGSDAIGALSYADVFGRLAAHAAHTGERFDTIVLATGSTGTHVGLLLGAALLEEPVRVIGVAVSQPAEVQRERTARLWRETAALHGAPADGATIEIDDRFLGPGYAKASAEGEAAAAAFLRREGIVLDAVYSAKAAAALLAWRDGGEFERSSRVLFVHTGGNGGLYY